MYDSHSIGAAPPPFDMAQGGNRLLAALSADDLRALEPGATRVRLLRDDVLTAPGKAIDAAFFIENGVASVVSVDAAGERTEICMLGREGMCGTPLVTADGRWPFLTFVQTDELRAVRVPAATLSAAVSRRARIRTLLVRAAHLMTIQIAEGLVSAAWQPVRARLARWLLMYRDRLGSNHIPTTHDFIAVMVGSQRSVVTVALHDLEGSGIITASRGLILIRDERALEELAGDHYGVADREQARLIR